jgi:hypothetical protein
MHNKIIEWKRHHAKIKKLKNTSGRNGRDQYQSPRESDCLLIAQSR